MLNNITFNKGQGGLGRPLPGSDYISGLIFYDSTLPTGFSTASNIKEIYSVQEAINLGIDANDETRAIATITITGTPVSGQTLNIKSPIGGSIGTKTVAGGVLVDGPYQYDTLPTYTVSSAATSSSIAASELAAFINSSDNGYDASVASSVVTIKAKKGLGTFPNTKSLVVTGTLTSTQTAYTGGVASKNEVKLYHISEYFRIQPKGRLFVGIFPIPSTYNFNEISTIQLFANGKIRQIGIYTQRTFTTADVQAIQIVCDTLDASITPISVLLAEDLSSITNLSLLSDLSSLNSSKVSVVLGQDAGGDGNRIAWGINKSVTVLGALLGAVSLAKVNEDIAWVSKFNISDGKECEVIGFANGVPYSDASNSTQLISVTDSKRYIFLRKLANVNGSFFNDSHTSILINSDYAYIENNRTIDKAIRGVYSDLIPNLNSPILLNSDGTMADSTIAYLESQATISTNQMVRDIEVSAVGVKIDPNQNVASTSTINVTVDIVPIGTARNIIVNIGFKTSL
jgi:hypothetical protein